MPNDKHLVASVTVGFSPQFVDMMSFIDEVDELCDMLPEWHADTVAKIQTQALRLCREAIKEHHNDD